MIIDSVDSRVILETPTVPGNQLASVITTEIWSKACAARLAAWVNAGLDISQDTDMTEANGRGALSGWHCPCVPSKNSFHIFHLPRSCPGSAEMALKMVALQFSYVKPCQCQWNSWQDDNLGSVSVTIVCHLCLCININATLYSIQPSACSRRH
jgi:hypothetical protein